MKLVSKFTALLVLAISIVIGEHAWSTADAQTTAFVTDMRADHRVLGRALRSLAEDALEKGEGSPAAAALIHTAGRTAGHVSLDWLTSPTGDRTLDTAFDGGEAQESTTDELVSLFPVRMGGAVVAVIRLRESFDERNALGHSARMAALRHFGTIMAVSAFLAIVLGRWLVGRPVERLVDKTRRMGTGDLGGPLQLVRNDELGELATALNASCDDLSSANARAKRELEARIAAQGQLRHAERLATVGKLAAGLAHELGTPLSIVSGHAQMIAQGEVVGDQVQKSASAIDREASRMGRIIRQLLDFARRKGPEGTTSDLAEIAGRCVALLRPLADKRSVKLEAEWADGTKAAELQVHRAIVDEDAAQQVITNLITNAIQAMSGPGGEVRISLSEERPPAGEGQDEKGDETMVRLAIADTGPGIPDDVAPHVFEPFFTTKEVGEGTGLGLSVVHGIVRDHDGRIEMKTGASGTTFTVFFPRATT